MKHTRNTTVTVLAIGVTLAATLSGCASPGTQSPEHAAVDPAQNATKIGLISSANNEWGNCMQGGVEAAATEANVELIVANSDADAARELANLEDMISRGVDAILLNTVSVDALEGGIQKAKAAGIPLYLIAVVPESLDDVLGATVVDLGKVGELAADWIATDAAGSPAKAAVIAGAPGAASDYTVKGFEAALPDSVEVVANQPGMYNRAKAVEVAENTIEAAPDLDYAFVVNEDMAFGARAAFAAAGKDDVKIVTQNGTDAGLAALETGEFSATVADSAMHLGELSFENAVSLLKDPAGEKIAEMDAALITVNNLDQAIPFCG